MKKLLFSSAMLLGIGFASAQVVVPVKPGDADVKAFAKYFSAAGTIQIVNLREPGRDGKSVIESGPYIAIASKNHKNEMSEPTYIGANVDGPFISVVNAKGKRLNIDLVKLAEMMNKGK